MSKHEDARDCRGEGSEKQTCLLQPKYDGGHYLRTSTCPIFHYSANLQLMSYCTTAQQSMRSSRRAPHTTTSGFFHPPQPSMSCLRAAIVQPLRTHQAKSIPRLEYSACQSLHSATVGRHDDLERCSFDPL